MNTYRFKIENYHSIGKADIALNGITVLAGINGSGKSTLARWLYYIVKGANEYEKNCFEEFKQSMHDFMYRYEKILIEMIMKNIIVDEQILPTLQKTRESINAFHYSNMSSFDKITEVYLLFTFNFVNTLKKAFTSMDISNKNRIFNYLQIEKKHDESDDVALDNFFIQQKRNGAIIIGKHLTLRNVRPIDKLYKYIREHYKEQEYPQKISFQEDGVEIINKEEMFDPQNESLRIDEAILTKGKIGVIFGLKSAIYIDTPMALSVTKSDNSFWNEIKELLKNNIDKTGNNNVINNLLSYLRSITGGKVIDKQDVVGDDELCFTRASDNLTIKLEQMATGIKSFAYLDRLLENGYLTQGNILIIDEPEAHLHPQWIVEYARMLVQIHKETGLYVMLASHDPDMVSAIRYIAEKEEVLDDTTFYLAEQDNNAETFTYRELGHDIEPIFASFNKSFDLIEKYGVDNGK